MSDTTTPSAAEVVGGPHTHGRPYSICWCDIDDFPDVDQMLEFLRGRGYWPIMGPQDDRPDWDVMEVELMYATDETDNGIGCQGFYDAPTLHAALEAAVIAVGRGL